MFFLALTSVIIITTLASLGLTYLWYKFILKIPYLNTKVKLFVELVCNALLTTTILIVFVPFGFYFSLMNGFILSVGILFPVLLSNANLSEAFSVKHFLLNFSLKSIQLITSFVLIGFANATFLMPIFE